METKTARHGKARHGMAWHGKTTQVIIKLCEVRWVGDGGDPGP